MIDDGDESRQCAVAVGVHGERKITVEQSKARYKQVSKSIETHPHTSTCNQ